MDLSKEAITQLLGCENDIPLTSQAMIKKLKVTVFPPATQKKNLVEFQHKLIRCLKAVGVNILPLNDVMVSRQGKKMIQKGVAVISCGDYLPGEMPIDQISSSFDNPIVAVIDASAAMHRENTDRDNVEIGLSLFSWYMCNIAVSLNSDGWRMYSFNGFSPYYRYADNFKNIIINSLIPKIAMRITPLRLNNLILIKGVKDFIDDFQTRPYTKDLIKSSRMMSHIKLFYATKNLDDFKYKNRFYQKVANVHMDERSGMSYGFIARQLPTKLPPLIPIRLFKWKEKFKRKDYAFIDDKYFVLLDVNKNRYVLEVPPVWVVMSRSGANKRRLCAHKDIVKIGLVNGNIVMEIPPSTTFSSMYKPSFDTHLILAHCLANVIYGSVIKNFGPKQKFFAKMIEASGTGIIHWHGQLLPELIPPGWSVYGEDNIPTLCSSPQSAIFAFKGKAAAVKKSLSGKVEYMGDVHIEPQHGVNIVGGTLKRLAHYLTASSFLSTPMITDEKWT